MKYKSLIDHILRNAYIYLEEFKDKELTDNERGLLLGLWMDIDSIKNHLEIEEEEIDIDLDTIMQDLWKLIGE